MTRQLLDPAIIARLRGLDFRARAVVAGFISGMHRSAYHGFSVEFAEHRQYVPGDDLRYIDWRIFGRADRFYVKEYESETNLRCNILLDSSHSMSYQGESAARGRSKYEYAAQLAASLAWLLTSQQDAVGLILFDHEIRERLTAAAGKRQLHEIVSLLERSAPAAHTDVKILFHQLAEELRKRSMVVLISDLLTEPEEVLSGVEHICHAGHELILLHVLDHDEWVLPFVDNVLFEGLEDDAELLADPQALRDSYRAALSDFSRRVEAVCLKHHADYVPIDTREPLEKVLTAYLAKRSGRMGRSAPLTRGAKER